MMKLTKSVSLISAMLAAQIGFSTPAVAGGEKILVELFTSQGCSSCPPADAILGELSDRDDVVALSLHVDYWDYLGWKDTFAQPEFTRRQIDYRDARGERVIYTPQVVVNGGESFVGSDQGGMEVALGGQESNSGHVGIFLEVGPGDGVTARLVPSSSGVSGNLWYATYKPQATVKINRGENSGRDITYHNVVTSLNPLGSWDGAQEASVKLPMPEDGEGIAIWVQAGKGGPVVAAESYQPAL